jgi:hypothetical protein
MGIQAQRTQSGTFNAQHQRSKRSEPAYAGCYKFKKRRISMRMISNGSLFFVEMAKGN